MLTPRLWLSVPAFATQDPGGWQRLLQLAQAADRAGVDGIALAGEHVVFGEHLDEYSRPEIGGRVAAEQPTGPDGYFLEPITTLSVISGMTSRVQLSTLILLAALRRPVVLAKTLATLDVLSGGRLEIGVGVGWQREEYEAAGLQFHARGRLLDHTLEVCQLLWREERASYSSEELSFSGIHMMPKPERTAGVPIWVSGTVNPRAMRRLARFGHGWIPWGDAWYVRDSLLESVSRMRDAVSAFGRDPAELRVACRLPVDEVAHSNPGAGRAMDDIASLVLGEVTDFYAISPLPEDQTAAEEHLARLVASFRAATASVLSTHPVD